MAAALTYFLRFEAVLREPSSIAAA